MASDDVKRGIVDLEAVLERNHLVETPPRLHATQRVDTRDLPERPPVFGDDAPLVDSRGAAEAHERHFAPMSLDNGSRLLDEPVVLRSGVDAREDRARQALAVVSLPTLGIP